MKSELNVEIVNALTRNGKNGNPAGVVLEANSLSKVERQRIAAQVGYSETAFLEKTSTGDYRVEFYTPVRPIAFCGHATVATFSLLKSLGMEPRSFLNVEVSGTSMQVHYDGDQVFMQQRGPRYESLDDQRLMEVLEAIGLEREQVDPAFRPQVVDTGNRFMLVSLRSREDLAALRADHSRIKEISEKMGLIGFYVFLRISGEHAATSRMFAPLYGILEEAATGMAAGPLAAVLVEQFGVSAGEIRLLQGEFMSPSQGSEIVVRAEVRDSRVVALKVGGRSTRREAVLVSLF